jgi:uncharacterized protein
MPPLHEKLAARLLNHLADGLFFRPWHFLLPQLVLLAVCVGLTVSHLQFSANRADLISPQNKHQRDFQQFKREFSFPDSLVAVVESGDPDKNRRFVERVAWRLDQEPDLFADTYYRGDLKLMGEKALLFLPEEALEEIKETIEKNWAVIEAFSHAACLNTLLERINRQFREEEEMLDEEQAPAVLSGLERLLYEATRSVMGHRIDPAPGLSAILGDSSRPYLSLAGGQIYAVITHAPRTELESEAVQRLRQLVHETEGEIPGVNAGITGEPVLNHDEMAQARRDIGVAAVISLFLVSLIFIYGYNEIARPLLATLCLLVGIGYTLGFATLSVGRLNLLSITLVPMLIGLAIDFGVHLISRFEEEIRQGRGKRGAMRKALVFTGLGIFTSAFTIAGAFFAMVFTEFKGIREMGLISSVGLLVCLVPMMTLLPLLLVRGRPDVPREEEGLHVGPPCRSSSRARIEQVWLCRPKLVVFCALIFTGFCVSQWPRLHFDYNLLNLQSRNLPAVILENKLANAGSHSLLFAVVTANSIEEASELEQRIGELPPVAGVTSMVRYLTEDQERKLELVRQIKIMVESLDLPPLNGSPMEMERLKRNLFIVQSYFGLAADNMQEDRKDQMEALEAQFRRVREAGARLRLAVLREEQAAPRLAVFEASLFGNLHETLMMIRQQDDRERLLLDDLPRFLRDRFVSNSGKYLLQVHPREGVWERPAQEQFVQALREVDPDITGTLVQIYEYTTMLKENFIKASSYAAAIIAFLVLLHFRRLSSVLLAFVPVVMGSCWMLGLMGFFGIPFNPVNMMALTLVIGIGVANGIHILNRFAEEPHATLLAKSTGKAVLVSAFTSMAGFGSLMAAQHQGIASLGKVMAIGTGMCMLASLTLLPALLHLLTQRGWKMTPSKKEQKPGRLVSPQDAPALPN